MRTEGTFASFTCAADPADSMTAFFLPTEYNDADDGCITIDVSQDREVSSVRLSNGDARELATRILAHLPPLEDA